MDKFIRKRISKNRKQANFCKLLYHVMDIQEK